MLSIIFSYMTDLYPGGGGDACRRRRPVEIRVSFAGKWLRHEKSSVCTGKSEEPVLINTGRKAL
jgi:hypothetical protein